MSYAHKAEFDRIKREHEEVVTLLKSLAEKGRKAKKSRQNTLPYLPSFDPARIEAAVATADDAYALLLIATSERFVRACLVSLGTPPRERQTLSSMIDQCRKEFNKLNPHIQIHPKDVIAVHDLIEQRNEYAHGHGAHVFSPVRSVVATLGKFFDQLP